MPSNKWHGYAAQKVGLAFDKLAGSPGAAWGEPPLVGAQSDLTAVDDDDVPAAARADLDVVRRATAITVEVVQAIGRLQVKVLEARAQGLVEND
jgi:hypothetical protein